MNPPPPENKIINSHPEHADNNVVTSVPPTPLSYYLNVIRNNTLSKEYKLITGGELISNDAPKHSLNGQQVVFQVLLVVKITGYNDYLSC